LNQRFSAIGLNVSLAGEYIGRRLDSDYNELGGYGLVNAALTQEIGKNLQIFAKANNLFGTENIADEYDLDGARYLVGLKVNF
jgi:outer membrane receptor protein involved in Fe transport